MVRRSLLALCIITALLSSAAAKTVRLKDPSSGTHVRLRVGDELEIAVMEIPSTGYRWGVDDDDSSLLEYVGREGKMPSKHRIGAGYWLKFRFRAVAAGTGEVVLVQSGRGEADRVTVAIEVRDRSSK